MYSSVTEGNIILLPWILKKKVLPQHTDHAGVMWHGSYLNWLEEARIDSLLKVGLSYAELSLVGYEMPVVDLRIKYINSLRHGDNVVLKSWVLPPQGLKMPWKTVFVKNNGECAAEALVLLVLLERIKTNFRVIRKKPEYLANAFYDLQKGPIE